MNIAADILEAAREAGERNGVSPAALLAVAIVETNAVAFAPMGNAQEPLIRFEGHFFDRLLTGEARERARAAGLAHPRAGAVRNPRGQAARWALLERARLVDEGAADQSTSWGLGQVMGAHWQALGFRDVAELVATARGSATGQFTLAARFLREGGLHQLLERGDHAGFARRYNGPLFRTNRYDEKIARALEQARRYLALPALLQVGARGPAVLALQQALGGQGFALTPDAIFGPATVEAVRHFQTREGLAADGIAGPLTLARLSAPR